MRVWFTFSVNLLVLLPFLSIVSIGICNAVNSQFFLFHIVALAVRIATDGLVNLILLHTQTGLSSRLIDSLIRSCQQYVHACYIDAS